MTVGAFLANEYIVTTLGRGSYKRLQRHVKAIRDVRGFSGGKEEITPWDVALLVYVTCVTPENKDADHSINIAPWVRKGKVSIIDFLAETFNPEKITYDELSSKIKVIDFSQLNGSVVVVSPDGKESMYAEDQIINTNKDFWGNKILEAGYNIKTQIRLNFIGTVRKLIQQ